MIDEDVAAHKAQLERYLYERAPHEHECGTCRFTWRCVDRSCNGPFVWDCNYGGPLTDMRFMQASEKRHEDKRKSKEKSGGGE